MARVIGKRFQKIEQLATAAPVSMVKVIVHLATCGIIAAARNIMDAVIEEVEAESDLVLEHLPGQPSLLGFAELVGVDEIQVRENDPTAAGQEPVSRVAEAEDQEALQRQTTQMLLVGTD